VVTTVGISTGPFTVGPMIEAPTVTGCCVTNECSFSLAHAPGEIKVSAIL